MLGSVQDHLSAGYLETWIFTPLPNSSDNPL